MATLAERFRDWVLPPMKQMSLPEETLAQLLSRMSTATTRTQPWRAPSVRMALGVPGIASAVSLISGTTGMLSMQGYQRGALLADPPRIIVRPDPYNTPQSFYAGTAANMAKYGEFVWWIAKRDAEGFATSLVLVPLNELQVTDNPSNRLMPDYRWGEKTGTRFSGANPRGDFVHEKYPTGEPLALRGSGPLQLCNAAASVAVEAQEWAANFYADGGNPSVVIKHAGQLDGTADADGYNEAERLRNQFMEKSHNVPRVIDQNIESIDYHQPTEAGAQMLDSRMYQNGDAARMFRVPGSLLEYQASGASLTYQNLEGEFTKLIRTCLQPLYLEPIEQAMSDLQPRSIISRFNVKGFLRADIKTRFEVYGMAIDKGIYDAAYAQQEEGILPGDVEYAPVPFSTPQSIPAPLRAASLEMRDVRCPQCQRLVVRASGAVEGWCRHCKATVAA